MIPFFLSILTAFLTVLTFVIGQFFLKLLIEPAQDLIKSLGNTIHTLFFYHSKLTNATPDAEIAKEIKARSSEILSKTNTILWYDKYKKFHIFLDLPSVADISDASICLNRISYNMLPESRDFENSSGFNVEKKSDHALENSEMIAKIGRLLKVKLDYSNI